MKDMILEPIFDCVEFEPKYEENLHALGAYKTSLTPKQFRRMAGIASSSDDESEVDDQDGLRMNVIIDD